MIEQIVEEIIVKRNAFVDKTIIAEIERIAKDNGLLTIVELNETAIVDALKKQTPKRPRYYGTKFRQRGQRYGELVTIEPAYNCPNCNCTVWGLDKDRNCKHCGQALEWSENEKGGEG